MAVEVDQRVHIAAPPERVWRALTRARRPAALALPERRGGRARGRLRGASRSRTGRRRAACTTPRSTSAGRSSSSRRDGCSPCSSSRRTGASCASSSPLRATAASCASRSADSRATRTGSPTSAAAGARSATASRCSARSARSRRRAASRRRAPPSACSSPPSSPGRSPSSRERQPAAAPLLVRRARADRARACPGRRRRARLRGRGARRPATRSAVALRAGADLEAARASLERSLPRRGLDEPRARCASPSTPRTPRLGCELDPALPPSCRSSQIPSRSCARSSASFCAPGRASALAYFAPGGALALAGGPHPRPIDMPLARLPARRRGALLAPSAGPRRRAHGRLGGQRLDGRPQSRHEHLDVRRRRPHRRGSSCASTRLFRAWSLHERALGRGAARRARRAGAHASRRARRGRARRLARDRATRGAALSRGRPSTSPPPCASRSSTACRSSRAAVAPRLTGGDGADRGGLVIAFNRMQAILEIDLDERTALVQPGHPNARLDKVARRNGLRYTPDPVVAGGLGDRRQHRDECRAACTAWATASRPTTCSASRSCFGDGTIAWLEDTDARRSARARHWAARARSRS